MNGRHWTEAELEMLRRLNDVPERELEVFIPKYFPNRTLEGVAAKRFELRQQGVLPRLEKYKHISTHDLIYAVQKGKTLAQMADYFGVSPAVLYRRFAALGGKRSIKQDFIFDLSRVAKLFDVGRPIVRRWIREKMLYAKITRRMKLIYRYNIMFDDIQQFMENPKYWMAWEPKRITDPDWKTYGFYIRNKGAGEWLRAADVANQYHYAVTTIKRWIRLGLLPAVKTYGYGDLSPGWFVWSQDLIDFKPPFDK